MYGKNWGKITEHIGTRTRDQTTAYGHRLASKFRKDPTLKGAHLIRKLEMKATKAELWTKEEQ